MAFIWLDETAHNPEGWFWDWRDGPQPEDGRPLSAQARRGNHGQRMTNSGLALPDRKEVSIGDVERRL